MNKIFPESRHFFGLGQFQMDKKKIGSNNLIFDQATFTYSFTPF